MTAPLRYEELLRNLVLNPRGIAPDPVAAYVEVRRNLHPNPGVESGLVGWATNNATYWAGARVTANQKSGTACYEITRSATFGGGYDAYASSTYHAGVALTDLKVAPAQKVAASIAVQAGAANRRAILTLAFRNAAGVAVGNVAMPAVALTANTWVTLTAGGVAPAGADSVLLLIEVSSVDGSAIPAGEKTRFDELLLEPGVSSPGPYFDGSTPGADPYLYVWTGAAHASASVQQSPKPADWTPSSGGTVPVVYQATDPDGTRFVRSVVRAAGATSVLIGAGATTYPAGTVFTALCRVRVNRAQTIRPRYSLVSGVEAVLPADTWQWITVTGPLAATKGVEVQPLLTAAQVGDQFDVSHVLAIAGAYSGTYFDGDTPDPVGTNLSYEWTGTAHASASVYRQAMLDRTVPRPAIFVPSSSRVWTVGDPDNPDLWWNGVDPYGVEWVIADPKGWYESPPVNLGLEDKPTDGAWFGRGAYKARVVEINGAFRMCRGGQDELDEIRERLQAPFAPDTDTLLAVTERIPKQLTVRPSSEVAVHPVRGQRRAGTFSLVLTAADPFKYAAGEAGQETTVLFLLDPTAVGGMTHDVVHPLDHGGVDLAALGWQKTVQNIGNVPSLPLVRFVGPVPAPTLTNATTGQSFSLGRDLPAGVEAVIDMEMRTVTVGGSSDFSAKAPRSNFWALAKGANDIRFTAGSFSAAARAYLTWRPRWK